VDLNCLLSAPDAVRISSGQPNRTKLLYRLDTPLPTLQLADGAIEFRCATRNGATTQDVIPPSLHPSGKNYQWDYHEPLVGHWSMLPPVPAELLSLWKSLINWPSSSANPTRAATPDNLRRLEQALAKRDPDCIYNEWIRAGMALHYESGGSEEGFRIWHEWSAKGTKEYKSEDDLRSHWKSFSSEPGKTVVTGGSILRDCAAMADEFINEESGSNKPRFVPVPDHQFVERQPLTWHIKGVVPKAELVVIYGQSGSGKSFLVFDMIAAIAIGVPWQGRNTTKGRTVVVLAEGASGFRNRLLAYAKQHAGCFPGIRIIADAPNLLHEQDHALLAQQIQLSGGADVIVIDTLAAVSPGADENTAKDMGRVIEHCKQLQRATGATVVLIHHSGKDESKGARGWSGLRAATDAEIEVNRKGDHRMATVTKLKDGEDGAKFFFKLVPVDIGIDPDGEPVTSCVVEPLPVTPTSHRKEPRPGTDERAMLDAIRDSPLKDGWASISSVIETIVPQFPKPEGRDTRRQHLLRALRALAAKALISVEGELCRAL